MEKEDEEKIRKCDNRSLCPISKVLDLLGDKWTLLIIRDMEFLQKKQFSEFLESWEGISTNILSDRLNKLEQYKLITKTAYQTNPTRYEYNLTRIGHSLRPLLLHIMQWGSNYIEDTKALSEDEIETLRQSLSKNKS